MIKIRQLGRIAAHWMLDHSIWVCAFIVLLSMLPLLILGQDSYVTIHDNLDSEVVRRVLLVRSRGELFDPQGSIEQVMNGAPRAGLPPGLNILTWLFVALKPFQAYVVNYFLVHAIAFAGMYLLLSQHVTEDPTIAAGAAACFAVLPLYTMFGLSVAGQPLVAFAFLNIRDHRARVSDFALLGIFALYSSFFLAGVFVLTILTLRFAAASLCNRKVNVCFALGIFLLVFIYAVANYPIIDPLYGSRSLVPHRIEYDFRAGSVPFYQAVARTFHNFLRGQYHAVSLHQYIALVALPLSGVAAYQKGLSFRSIVVLLLLCLVFSVVHGLREWDALLPLKEQVSLLRTFNFGRFHWLNPMLWYVLLAMACSLIASLDLGDLGTGHSLAVALICLQLLYILRHNAEFTQSIRSAMRRTLGVPDHTITYARFYSEDLFQDLVSFIGEPQENYRVVSLGLHPAVSQYNGFYTLDAYLTLYPVEYKQRFREIIAPELEKSQRWRDYFDGWGTRCYIFSSELDGFMSTKWDNARVQNLALNADALKEMGGGVHPLSRGNPQPSGERPPSA